MVSFYHGKKQFLIAVINARGFQAASLHAKNRHSPSLSFCFIMRKRWAWLLFLRVFINQKLILKMIFSEGTENSILYFKAEGKSGLLMVSVYRKFLSSSHTQRSKFNVNRDGCWSEKKWCKLFYRFNALLLPPSPQHSPTSKENQGRKNSQMPLYI